MWFRIKQKSLSPDPEFWLIRYPIKNLRSSEDTEPCESGSYPFFINIFFCIAGQTSITSITRSYMEEGPCHHFIFECKCIIFASIYRLFFYFCFLRTVAFVFPMWMMFVELQGADDKLGQTLQTHCKQ